MGFMDLSIIGSDQAADSASVVVEAFAKALEKEFKEEANEWNTPGWLNVAMIIDEMCNHTMFLNNDRIQKLAKKCLVQLEKTPRYGDSTIRIRKSIEKFIECS
jgi:hypothetical protein